MNITGIQEIRGFTDWMDGGSLSMHAVARDGNEFEVIVDLRPNSITFGKIFAGHYVGGVIFTATQTQLLVSALKQFESENIGQRKSVDEFLQAIKE